MPRACGANTAPIAFAEVYLALQNGTVDAQENPLTTIEAKKFYEVQSHINLTGHITESLVTVVGSGTWGKLSADDRKLFGEVLWEASTRATNEIAQAEAALVSDFEKRGKTVLKKQLKRDQMMAFFTNLPPCLIGMEACGSAHYWANKLQRLGHTVKLMAPQFVKPYVKTNKNDVADAEAICEAVSRPNMRFVPIKNSEQQAVLALHRARQGFVKARTAQANQIRGLLAALLIKSKVGYSLPNPPGGLS